MQIFKIKIALIILSLCITSCITTPKKSEPIPPLTTKDNYQKAFETVKSYIVKCHNPVNMRANLFTEFPEAEIIIDQLGRATGYIVGTTFASSSASANEIINLKFKEVERKTTITSSNGLSYALAIRALNNESCLKN